MSRPLLRARRGRAGATSAAAPRRRTGLSAGGLLVLAMVACAWFLGRRIASRPVLTMAYGLLLLVGVAWFLSSRKVQLDVNRSKVPTRLREGQPVEVVLEVTARRRVATLVLEEMLPEPLGSPVRFPVPVLQRAKTTEVSYAFVPRRRGIYDVGPLVAEWSDPFGLTRRRALLDEPVRVIVHPSTEMVHDRVVSRAWEDPPVRPPFSKPWPTGFEFYGMRDYVLGDDPRRINWRATARTLDLSTGTGRYLVREAEQGITDRIQIFLDTDASTHSPGDPSDTFEAAVRAAASLGVKHLRDGFALTVNGNGGRIATGLRGRPAELTLLDNLAAVAAGDTPLVTSLERLLVERTGATHNLVITPHLSRPAAMRLRHAINRGISLLLVIPMWDDTDPATPQRAAMLGCGVVEIRQGDALEKVFRHVVGSRR